MKKIIKTIFISIGILITSCSSDSVDEQEIQSRGLLKRMEIKRNSRTSVQEY